MSIACHAFVIHIAVQTPLHSNVGGLLSYTHGQALPPGTLVRVRLGTRPLLGVVWEAPQDAEPVPASATVDVLPPFAGG